MFVSAHTPSFGNQEDGGGGGGGKCTHLLQQLLAMTFQGTQLAIEEATQVHHSFLLLFCQLQSRLQETRKRKLYAFQQV